MICAFRNPLVQTAELLNGKLSQARKKILGEGLWVLFGQFSSAAGALVGMRLLTEYVNPETFGRVSLFLGIITLGSNLTSAPLFQAVLRLYPEMALESSTMVLRAAVEELLLKISMILLGLLFLAGCLQSCLSHQVLWIYLPMAGVLIFDTLRGLESNFLSAARRQRPFAIWCAFEAWSRPAAAIGATVIWKPCPEAVLLGYCLATAIGWIIFRSKNTVALPNNLGCADANKTQVKKQILAYAGPLIPVAIVVWIISLSDRYLIGGMLDLGQVGLYVAAYGLVSRPFLILGSSITLTLRPLYYEAVSNGDERTINKVFFSWLGLTVIISALGVLGFVLCDGKLGSLFLAEKYRGAMAIMPWIATGHAFYILANVYEQVICARKQTQLLLKIQSAVAACTLVTTILGIEAFGLKGAALACPVYYSFHLVLTKVFVAKSHPKFALPDRSAPHSV